MRCGGQLVEISGALRQHPVNAHLHEGERRREERRGERNGVIRGGEEIREEWSASRRGEEGRKKERNGVIRGGEEKREEWSD